MSIDPRKQRDPLWQGIFWALLLMALAAVLIGCPGCTYTKATAPNGAIVEFWRFGTSTEAGQIDIDLQNGVAHVEGLKTEQVQSAGAIAEGVAKGLRP